MRAAHGKGMRLAGGLAAIALVTTFASSMAPAATLDAMTCDQLKRDVVDLEKLGTRVNLAKGPVWGKANLRSAQLEQVKKLIEIEETIAFRCPRPKPPVDPQAATAGKAKAPKAAKAAPKSPGAPKTVEEAVLAKPAPKPRPKAPAAAAEGGTKTVAAPPKPRPKPPAPKMPDTNAAAPRAPAQQ